jgi:hypothetical protein
MPTLPRCIKLSIIYCGEEKCLLTPLHGGQDTYLLTCGLVLHGPGRASQGTSGPEWSRSHLCSLTGTLSLLQFSVFGALFSVFSSFFTDAGILFQNFNHPLTEEVPSIRVTQSLITSSG